MKIKEIIKVVEEDGWYYVHSKGSHRKFHHAVIAGKPSADVHPEILNSIFKQAQIKKNKIE